jgi:hypothetical protein
MQSGLFEFIIGGDISIDMAQYCTLDLMMRDNVFEKGIEISLRVVGECYG